MLQRLWADEPAYGAALTDMVLRPVDVAAFCAHALAVTDSVDTKLRLRLNVDAPARFQAVRWESLREPSIGTPIATRLNVLFSRYFSSPKWRPIAPLVRRNLRTLAVIAAPQDVENYSSKGRVLAAVDVGGELGRARRALAGLQVSELYGRDATLHSMFGVLEQGIDVLYLVCHTKLTDDGPQLFFEGPTGTAVVVDGRQLAERLSELKQPPGVLLLCSPQPIGRGEMWSVGNGELAALGPRLMAAGVAAVIAMQGTISMPSVEAFTPTFFGALAKHGVVDEAMATARRSHSRRRGLVGTHSVHQAPLWSRVL